MSIHRFKIQLGLEATTLTDADNERLQTAYFAAIAQLEHLTRRHFTPRLATIPHHFTDPLELALDDDLQQITSVTNGDGTTIAAGDVEVVSSGLLRLKNGVSFLLSPDGDMKPIQITGIWGWHDHWDEAWRSSGDVINDELESPGTGNIPVMDADGNDPYTLTPPRFAAGQLLRVGSEYMLVIEIDAETNTLMVLRGQNGTQTTAHEPGQSIAIYALPPQIENLMLRIAVWLYKSPEMQIGGSIPPELAEEARLLRRDQVKV